MIERTHRLRKDEKKKNEAEFHAMEQVGKYWRKKAEIGNGQTQRSKE